MPWTDEQKDAFIRQQFDAQTAYWDEQYPDAERSIVEVDGQPAGRLYVQRWPKEIRLVDVALLPDVPAPRRRDGAPRAPLRGSAASGACPSRSTSRSSTPRAPSTSGSGSPPKGEQGMYVLMEWKPEAVGAGVGVS